LVASTFAGSLACKFFNPVAFCRAHNTFFDWSLPLLGGSVYFFLSVCCRSAGSARHFFCPVASCQGAMQYPLCSSVNARTDFFCGVRSTAAAHAIFYFICFVRSLLLYWARAVFLWMLLLSPRTMLRPFFSLFGHFSSQPCMRVRGISNFSFLSSRFQQLRAKKNLAPHYCRVRSLLLL
jgi:hypothetical protein